MKRLFKFSIVFLLLTLAFSSFGKELKILTIGNSFTWSLKRHFVKLVKSVEGCDVKIEFANFGGCELSRHWKYIQHEEADSSKRIYFDGKKKLREALAETKWDIVTIQQASHESWRPETYTHAKDIVDYVKKYCPSAEIYIQQTWAYRADAPRLKAWGFSQQEMYEKVADAYAKTAKALNLKQIPSGYAVELARKELPTKFKPYTKEELASFYPPDVPKQAGDVVGSHFWSKNKKGEMSLHSDTIHLNYYGEYLQACVWFAYLFDKSAEEVKYVPKNMSISTAKMFQKVADKAVKEYK